MKISYNQGEVSIVITTDCNYAQNYVSIVKCTGSKSEQKKQGPFTLTHNKHWKNKVSKIFITSLGSNRGQRLQLKQNIEFSSLCIQTERFDDLYDNHIFAFKPLLDISRFLFKPLFYMLFFFSVFVLQNQDFTE